MLPIGAGDGKPIRSGISRERVAKVLDEGGKQSFGELRLSPVLSPGGGSFRLRPESAPQSTLSP